MRPDTPLADRDLEARARQSLGSSSAAIHRMVIDAVVRHDIRGAHVIDVGCGHGTLWPALRDRFAACSGLDAVRYAGFPHDVQFIAVNLDSAAWPVPRATADLVVAIETIEHLENPWAFARQLFALAAPGGWVIITTPNQLSALSLITLATRRRFSAFQDAHYPAHRTALLESDLLRTAAAAGLAPVEIAFSARGRVPLMSVHYPETLARLLPRLMSDNLMLISRKPRG